MTPRSFSDGNAELFKINVQGGSFTATRTELSARSHKAATDKPAERGGTNPSATPPETMLSSLLACTNVITNYVVGLMRTTIRHGDMRLAGSCDIRGVFGNADDSVPFALIELEVVLDTDADAAAVDASRQAVAGKCHVSVILRQAGTRFVEAWGTAASGRRKRSA